MKDHLTKSLFMLATIVLTGACAHAGPAADAQKEVGLKAIHAMAGCYQVDYIYTETESLKAGYTIDPRVYDVNRARTIKEWIYVDDVSDTKLRVQHLLFATELNGNVVEGSELKHQAEDWEYNAPFLYEFTSPLRWEVKQLPADGRWTRRVTNLDDGLRYQCAAHWNLTTAYPEWKCDTYAPIPGRETRDMQRKDYNTMRRTSRLQVSGSSWLEREDNIKTIDANGTRTPLAKEFGKNWYIRLPDSECAGMLSFMAPKKNFWNFLRQTWEEVLIGDRPFIEKAPGADGPRYAKMWEVEDKYSAQDLSQPTVKKAAHDEILQVIQAYRAN